MGHAKRMLSLWSEEAGQCFLCGLEVPNPAHVPLPSSGDPLNEIYPAAVRLIPKSAGGKGRSNLRLAHRFCSNKRGDKEITDELKAQIRRAHVERFGVPGKITVATEPYIGAPYKVSIKAMKDVAGTPAVFNVDIKVERNTPP